MKSLADRPLRRPGVRRSLRNRQLACSFFCACFAALLLSRSAYAQKVVLLPSNAGPAAEATDKTLRSAAADALRMQGLQVLGWDEVNGRLPPADRCEDASVCAQKVMQAAAVELAAAVLISRDPQGSVDKVRVALTDLDKRHYDGEAAVQQGDLRDATTRALLEARSFQLLGPGPWLRIEGTPEGAEVMLDERVVGKVPYRAAIIPGHHTLRVRESGYTPLEQELDVSATDDSHVVAIAVALEPAPIAASSSTARELRGPQTGAPQRQDSRGGAWLAGPLVVGGLGLVLAGVTTVRLATALDTCVNPDEYNVCSRRRTVNPAPTAIAYSLSAALIATSIAWVVIGASDENPALAASVGFGHVALSGSF